MTKDIELPERGFVDYTAVGDFGRTLAETCEPGTAERKHAECVIAAQAVLKVGQQAKADYDTAIAVGTQRNAELVRLRGLHDSKTEPDFITALSDTGTNIAKLAKEYADRAQIISFLTGVGQYARECAYPERLLTMLEADWNMAKMATALMAWECAIAAVKRYHAAQSLVETDGAATFAPIGRTHELFEQYLACSRREYRAYEGWQAAKSRKAEQDKVKGLL